MSRIHHILIRDLYINRDDWQKPIYAKVSNINTRPCYSYIITHEVGRIVAGVFPQRKVRAPQSKVLANG